MGTSDNTHVSNLKCCHYLMYFFCVGLFYYLMSCHLCCFSCRGHDRLRPNEMNLCSKPQTTCCTPRRNRFETVRQNIYIFLRGRSFSIFKLGVCSLILNLWIPQNEKKIKNIGAQLFYQTWGSWMGAEQLYWTFWTFWRFGTSVLSSGNYLSGIQ